MTWSEAIQALNQGREIKLAMAEANDKRIEARASERKPLTVEKIQQTALEHFGPNTLKWLEESAAGLARAIEAAHGIK